MKFLISTLACLLFAADAAFVKKTLKGSNVNKRKIFENAVKADGSGRRLQNEDFELSGAYSIQFNECVSLTAEPEDEDVMFDENLMAFTSDKKIIAQKSYVLFNVCLTRYCDYYTGNENLYMVDVNTYMEAVAEYYSGRSEEYCQACQDSQNYCKWVKYQKANKSEDWYWQGYSQNYGDNGDNEAVQNQYEGAQQNQADGGGRRLQNYGSMQVVDCDVCEDMKCSNQENQNANQNNYNYNYNDNANDYADGYQDANEAQEAEEEEEQDVELNDIAQWVSDFTQCQQTGYDFFNSDDYAYPLYAGFMCNEYGTGVEIAIFLDENCAIYDSTHMYARMAYDDDAKYMYKAEDLITYAFLHDISCDANTEYISVPEYREQMKNYQYDQGGNNEAGDASEFCQQLFEGGEDGEAASLRNCQDAEGDEQDYQEQENQQYQYYNAYQNQDWYEYTLSQEDVQDTASACMVVKNFQGDFERIYNTEGSGQLYDYSGQKNTLDTTTDIRDFFNVGDNMDATLITAIVAGVVIALVALSCIMWSCCSPTSLPNRYSRHRKHLEAKRNGRLVDEATGEIITS